MQIGNKPIRTAGLASSFHESDKSLSLQFRTCPPICFTEVSSKEMNLLIKYTASFNYFHERYYVFRFYLLSFFEKPHSLP